MQSAKTKRAQILMSPKEYQKLESIARAQQTSVAELIRRAVRERYLTSAHDQAESLQRIFSLGLPGLDWEAIEEDIGLN